jgi:hypothetical protein
MRFQVLMAVSMKITAFWEIAPRCLIEVEGRFGGSGDYRPGDGGSTHL